jgi:hypothetical protein
MFKSSRFSHSSTCWHLHPSLGSFVSCLSHLFLKRTVVNIYIYIYKCVETVEILFKIGFFALCFFQHRIPYSYIIHKSNCAVETSVLNTKPFAADPVTIICAFLYLFNNSGSSSSVNSFTPHVCYKADLQALKLLFNLFLHHCFWNIFIISSVLPWLMWPINSLKL